MTLTDAVLEAMECGKPYCNNAQVVVVKADVALSKITLVDSSTKATLDTKFTKDDFGDGIVVRRGKKNYKKAVLK